MFSLRRRELLQLAHELEDLSVADLWGGVGVGGGGASGGGGSGEARGAIEAIECAPLRAQRRSYIPG